MSCLNATFTLTPRSPWYFQNGQECYVNCFGSVFFAGPGFDLSSCYAADSLYFDDSNAADPNIDYTQVAKLLKVPFLDVYVDLRNFGTAKQLALIFSFKCWSTSRVLIYTNAGKIGDQTLATSDNQFLLQIDSLDSVFNLFFVHAGGEWFFNTKPYGDVID